MISLRHALNSDGFIELSFCNSKVYARHADDPTGQVDALCRSSMAYFFFDDGFRLFGDSSIRQSVAKADSTNQTLGRTESSIVTMTEVSHSEDPRIAGCCRKRAAVDLDFAELNP
ncbi:hypothetical protein N9448_06875 [Litorivicinus sp.]|nr:hypothetical protein [Litorivicinus sp.]